LSGSTVVAVPAGEAAVEVLVVVVVVVCVAAGAGVLAAAAEVCAKRTGELSLVFVPAVVVVVWVAVAGLLAAAGDGELVWACAKDHAATSAAVAQPRILNGFTIG